MADKESMNEVKSPIIMQVEGPSEDDKPSSDDSEDAPCKSSDSGEKSFKPVNQTNSNTTKIPSYVYPSTTVFNSNKNPFRLKSSVLGSPKQNDSNGKSILRPSLFSQSGTSPTKSNDSSQSKTTFKLNPPQLNAFSNLFELKKDSSSSNDPVKSSTSNGMKSDSNGQTAESSGQVDTTESSKSRTVEQPRFVPLSGTGSSNASSNSSSNISSTPSAPSFVFGQNLHARVIAETDGSEPSLLEPVASTSCSNGTSEVLFSSAVKPDTDKKSESSNESKSLSEAAKEYEESRAQKRKYEEVTVVTGEEDEQNVIQITCKLFAFDKATGNWQERGRGNLRLNDLIKDSETDPKDKSKRYTQSRLVFRSSGSLRVVLNTKIWAGMSVEQASPKSIRLTAMDSSGVVKVFLVMASQKEIENLHRLLKRRLETEIQRQHQLKSTSEDNIKEPPSKKLDVDSTEATEV